MLVTNLFVGGGPPHWANVFVTYFRAIVQKAASYSHLDICSRCLSLLCRVRLIADMSRFDSHISVHYQHLSDLHSMCADIL